MISIKTTHCLGEIKIELTKNLVNGEVFVAINGRCYDDDSTEQVSKIYNCVKTALNELHTKNTANNNGINS